MQMAEHAAPIWWKCPIHNPPFADKIEEFIHPHGGYNHHKSLRSFLLGVCGYSKFLEFLEIKSIISCESDLDPHV